MPSPIDLFSAPSASPPRPLRSLSDSLKPQAFPAPNGPNAFTIALMCPR